ncbi:MAG: response regulator [Candidatus Promineifilaceae bacterium]
MMSMINNHAELDTNNPIKVMVIDDDPMVLHLISMILRDDNYQISTATSVPMAWEHLEKDLPHVICCDLMMPGVTGIDFLQTRHELPGLKDVPVIVISGSGSDELFAQAKQLGSYAILAKPFTSQQLTTTINSAFIATAA